MNRITKGFMSLLMVFLLCFTSVGSFAEAAADVEKPVLKSISVDKKAAKVGDTVTYTAVVTDNVDVSRVYFTIVKPQTNNELFVRADNVGNNTYQYKIQMDTNTETGLWKITSVTAVDSSENNLYAYSKEKYSSGTYDFSGANVNVYENIISTPIFTEKPTTEKPTTERPTTEKPTTEKPTTEQPADSTKLLKSINVSTNKMKQGDTIKFTAKVLNDPNYKIESILLNYVDYENSNLLYLDLYPTSGDTLTLEKKIDDTIKAGKYKVTDVTVFYNGGQIQNFFNTKAEFGTKYSPYADYSNIDLMIEKSDKPVFLPSGALYSTSDYERKLHKVKVRYGSKVLVDRQYIAYQTTDTAIREAMSNVDSNLYYYDKVNVNKGYTWYNNGVITFNGTLSEIDIDVKAYADLNVVAPPTTERPTTEKPTTEKPTTERPITERPTTERPTTEKPTTERPTTEKPTTERPTTERPTTERPTTEKPTTERPTTEKPTTEKPTTERPTTERPTTERPTTERPTTERPTTEKPTTEKPTTEKLTTEKPVVKPAPKPITNTKPSVNSIDDNDTKVTGKAKSGSTVYAIVNKKVIGQGVAKDGKFSFTIKKLPAGTNVQVYSVYKKVKSNVIMIKVIDKTPPTFTSLNAMTTKSQYVSGKGEKDAVVTVMRSNKQIATAKVSSKNTFKVKVGAQKRGTTLTVYLIDKAGNVSKKSVKVS
ncbi:Ig-like domain-containing protein [Macrococcus brunensis]|uniref:Ig-like domain-containing protein n=1 Tax=Macrococcus brunensis TaxID=198483 RepID=UPI001EEF9430|nr:Ig-like domain-containing protein [Macrococcus brunensis]ULG71485.1 Ig-like domain-containing protein [Macrococcus brunensis]